VGDIIIYMIVDIKASPLKTKRYRVFMDNGKYYDFGLKNGNTYLDHHDKVIRENYIKRHYANPIENKLIDNLIPSPALFSMYLLWGKYTALKDNINHLNNLWIKKHYLLTNEN
jgi:hypothetical protein